MQIYINTIYMTLKVLFWVIYMQEGIPISEQRLITLIVDYNIQNKSTLQLCIKNK